MSFRQFAINKLGASALAIVIVLVIVFGIKALDASNRHENSQRAVEAHQIVFEACGSEAARRFERTFDGRSGWIKRTQAERWAADCAAKP